MTKRFEFVCTPRELKMLDKLAERDGRSRSDYLRRLIEQQHFGMKAGEKAAKLATLETSRTIDVDPEANPDGTRSPRL